MTDLDDPTRWLVTTDWLAEHLDDPKVRVLDVTGHLDAERSNQAHGAYLDAHIPGAVWFDVASGNGELSDPDSPLSWTWPPMSQIEAAMGRVGVDDDTRVVITARTSTDPYGLGTMWCTRTWWTLHHSGVDCCILDGGLERWTAEDRPTEAGDVTPLPRGFTGTDRRAEAIADRDDVLNALDDGASCVIDALPAASFDGSRVNYARPGHITGARNLPYATFIVEPTTVFVSADEARSIAEAAGLFEVERAVLY